MCRFLKKAHYKTKGHHAEFAKSGPDLRQLHAEHRGGGGRPLRAVPTQRAQALPDPGVPHRLRRVAAVERFENWIINPHGDLDSMKCAPCAAISQANDDTFTANAARVEGLLQAPAELPPLPPLDDEKVPELAPEMTMPSDR